ncbi:MAG: tail fiber domain-containing protein [Alphaproteobacteria bacterium]|nr:tail fiber domain-containing protein [Alphaproteobacteria bacterium]MBQ8630410.1 tail fiber domain-containing protein [Alphaproteobacteria bacterium]
MSKSIGKLLGGGGASTSMYGSERDYLNYLNKKDTSLIDNTLNNFNQSAYNLSQTLNNRPDYVYSVDGSDAARQRAENATYNSYVSKLTPQFEQQQRQLETRLQNQGLSVGSEAYQNAMNSMYRQQNEALNQASYNSVLQGQQAFSSSLSNAISAGNFSNAARQYPINEILQLMSRSMSGDDVALAKYQTQFGADSRIAQNKAANSASQYGIGNQFLSSAASAAAMAMLSDARVKENIYPVGRLDNGLTVYLFNYIGEDIPQIGLIAQEVAEYRPEAVLQDEYGLLHVNYALAAA